MKTMMLVVAAMLASGCSVERQVVVDYVTVTNVVEREVVRQVVREIVVTNYATRVEVVTVTNSLPATLGVDARALAMAAARLPVVTNTLDDAKKPSEMRGLAKPKPYSGGVTVHGARRNERRTRQ